MKRKVFWALRDNISRQMNEARYNFVSKYLKDRLVLDLGCGPRKEAYIFSENSQRVIASDISVKAVLYAKKHFLRRNLSYIAMDACEIAFKDNSFDVVVSLEVIEHLLDYHKFLKEVKRIIKPQGLCIFSTPHKRPIGVNPKDAVINPHHLKEFMLDEFKDILHKYFSNVEIFGQSLTIDITGKFGEFKHSLNRIGILKIKYLFPMKFRDYIYARIQSVVSPLTDGISRDKIAAKDYIFSKDFTKSTNLIAICTK